MWFLKHEKLFLKVKKGRRAYKQKKLHMQKKRACKRASVRGGCGNRRAEGQWPGF